MREPKSSTNPREENNGDCENQTDESLKQEEVENPLPINDFLNALYPLQ